MKKGLLALIAAVAISSAAIPVQASDDLKIGVGYFRYQAPVGARVWINDQLGIDFGIGFESKDRFGGGKEESKISLDVDAGAPFVVMGDETTKFFVRPGLRFRSDPVYDTAASDWTSAKEIWFSGTLGVEHFFSKWFSLEAAHGLVLKSIDPGLKGSDTSTEIATEDFGIAHVGFHFYIQGVN